ncbi:flagellar hook protein FlgE [Clostridiales bacterium]|nr:flagellar hook protein FlgE [Clostridiales bacterium]
MINGNGFFLVGPKNLGAGGEGITNDAESISGLKLTRVGAFTVDGDGYLVDENRNVVYGFFTKDGEPTTGTQEFEANTEVLRPIRISSGSANDGTGTDDDTMNVEQIAIDDNGILSGKGAAGEDGTEGTIYKFAQIALCNIPNPNALEKTGDSYYMIRNNTGTAEAFAPGMGTTGMLISNGLEMSKADLATEISNMIITERGFQANSKMITVSDEMLQELINMKR